MIYLFLKCILQDDHTVEMFSMESEVRLKPLSYPFKEFIFHLSFA